MTSKVIATIRSIVESDSIVAANLSKYEGYPALTFQTAQSDMQMPYVIMRIESNNPDDVAVVDRMVLNLDVYCNHGDYEKADTVATQIEKLLDREASLLREAGILTIHRMGRTPIPDEDPSVIHINLKFLVRTTRMDLYEKEDLHNES
ncbi:hypothetical protein BAMA_15765 [Bacillus manliponensis]|uniref:Uncharacterized protein n=1 Tax=Bacillus manliponensis TaxID=574376 RepID=A0A073K4Z6_9BACI|nr:DUF3168 domain-containing protein [Bacillus manliponensis]KEK17343.1 hypothetical protein BAMA_15765 [Bacillus manliponensis]